MPYNPVLCVKYNAHINVEVSHNIKSIKILYKYLLKGTDMIETVLIQENQEGQVSEVEKKAYQNTRYVTAYEAVR